MLEEPKIKKVDKRDKQLPQNFEQLIEMYDVEKIWPYMKKVIDYINNDLEKIKVNPREPTNNERVWLQKGKNLSKVSRFDEVNSSSGVWTVKIRVKENTNYTISATKRRISGVEISNKWFNGVGAAKAYDKSGKLLEDFFRDNAYYLETGSKRFDFSITTPQNTEYIIVDFFNNNSDYNLNMSVEDIQIEKGLIATEYEAYVDRKINIDGEEFLDVEKANNQQNYSTEEQVTGTWIDGKPIYRRVFTGISNTQAYVVIQNYVENVDTVVHSYGQLENSSGMKIALLSDTQSNVWDGNKFTVYVNNDGSDTYKYKLIYEYTKSTDV